MATKLVVYICIKEKVQVCNNENWSTLLLLWFYFMKSLIPIALLSAYAFVLGLIASFSLSDYEVKVYLFLIVCLVYFLFVYFVPFLILLLYIFLNGLFYYCFVSSVHDILVLCTWFVLLIWFDPSLIGFNSFCL